MLKALIGDDRYEEIFPALQEVTEKTGGISMCELLDKYINKGREIGMAQGMAQGMELAKRLIGDGRIEDIPRAISDREYQNKLLEEYGL